MYPDTTAPPEAEAEAAPPEAAQPNPYVTLPITEDQISDWFKEIEASIARRKTRETAWDLLMKEYMPVVTATGTPESVRVAGHFRNVHTKLAKMFHRLPDLHLEAKGPLLDPVMVNPQTGSPITAEDAVFIKQAVLNDKLGPDGVDGSRFMDEILFDAGQWAGIGCAKIGYRNVTKQVQQPVMVPAPVDPMTGQPAMDPATGAPATVQATEFNPITMSPEPKFEMVPVPIWEEWYMRRFSAKKLLLPADLASGRIDEDACWVGSEIFLTEAQMKRTYGYTPPEGQNAEDDRIIKYDEDGSATSPASKRKVHVYELFIKAAEYNDEELNPEVIYQLVLVEGDRTKPVVYRPSPDQTLDEMGKLTPDSLVGFPIELFHVRDLPDSPFPPADSAFTQGQIKFLNTHAAQSVALRDAAKARYLYDEGEFTTEEIERIKNGKVGDFMAVQPGKLAQGADKVIVPLAQVRATRDDTTTRNLIKQEMEETLGISANDAGVENEGAPKTATEIHDVSSKSAQRMGKDQQRAIQFWLRCVRKYDTLLMRYATRDEYVRITGQNGEKQLALWNNKIISGRYAYDIKPDSQNLIDAARDRQQTLTYYDKTLMDPLSNRFPILRKLASLFGLDPARVTNDPNMVAMQQAAQQNGPATDKRAHRETGGQPNAPESGAAPNAPRGM